MKSNQLYILSLSILIFILTINIVISVLSTSFNNNNNNEEKVELISPPIVDKYYLHNKHVNVIKLPKIEISMEKINTYNDEVDLFLDYFRRYEPIWPKDKIGLFPLAFSYSILEVIGNNKNHDQDMQENVIMLIGNMYSDGYWGYLNVWDEVISHEEFYKTLPEALDFFIPLLEYYIPDSIKARIGIAEIYAETTFFKARQRLYKYYQDSTESYIQDHWNTLNKDDLGKALHFLGNALYFANDLNVDNKTMPLSQQFHALKYFKYSYEMDKENIEREHSYREALNHLILEMIRDKLSQLHKKNQTKFKQWTKTIKKTFDKVDSIPYEELSYEDFFHNYALKRIPVVIKGLANVMSRNKTFDLKYLQSSCMYMEVEKKRHMADDVQNWAGLVGVATTTVGQFVDDIYQQRNITYETTKAFGGIPYIFDEGLANKGSNGCPKLLNDLTIPKYFTQDIGRMMTMQRYDTHPSLFVGPKNSSCGLHVDSSSSNFWQALFLGRKKWYFYPFEDGDAQILLHDSPIFSSFRVDPHTPAPENQPLFEFAQANRVEVIVEPGDVIFVPSDTPHAVKNLENIFAISHNYFDGSNLLRLAKNMWVDGINEDSKAFEEILGHEKAEIEKLKNIVRKYPKDMEYNDWTKLKLKDYFYGTIYDSGSDDEKGIYEDVIDDVKEDPWIIQPTTTNNNNNKKKDDLFLTYDWPSISSSIADLVHPVVGRKSFLLEDHIKDFYDSKLLENELRLDYDEYGHVIYVHHKGD